MGNEGVIAFATRPEPTALEVRVNFGVLTGREATPAELDELARQLLPVCGDVSLVAELRHEVSEQTEVALHQVRVEVSPDQLPASPSERAAFVERLVGACEEWALACAADRHAELTDL
jgi:hypothetical protein